MKKSVRLVLLFLGVGLSSILLAGSEQKPREGKEYELVIPEQPTQVEGGKVEVVEIFWYGCPHCYDFEPYLEKWLSELPPYAAFRRLPASFNARWLVHARAFYTAESLHVLDRVHQPLFEALTKDQKRFDTENDLAAFFTQHGVDEAQFRQTFTSFAVDAKVKQSSQMVRNYGITGVPAVIVNGKYRTAASLTGSYPALLQVVDLLIEKERVRAE
ncbi:MAG: thiol:disulfide interchange protein DsbA/DsbL [Gammaproteobacteria bacterium]